MMTNELQSGRDLVSAMYSPDEMAVRAHRGVVAYEGLRDEVRDDPFAQLGLLLSAAYDLETSGLLSRRQIAAFVACALGADIDEGEPIRPPWPPEIAVRIAPLMGDERIRLPR